MDEPRSEDRLIAAIRSAVGDRIAYVCFSGGIDSTFQKLSGKTIRHAFERHRCKSEIVLFDVESFEAIGSAID